MVDEKTSQVKEVYDFLNVESETLCQAAADLPQSPWPAC
jgi:hypothetical protein